MAIFGDQEGPINSQIRISLTLKEVLGQHPTFLRKRSLRLILNQKSIQNCIDDILQRRLGQIRSEKEIKHN